MSDTERKPGTWDSEAAREAAKRSWEKRRARAAEAAEHGAGEEPQHEGRSEALKALYAVLGAKDAPHAAVVAAARALLDAEAGLALSRPHSVAQVEALPTEALYRLAAQLEPAHPLPPEVEAALLQA